MFGRIDLLLIGAGLLVSLVGAALVDLWLIGVSLRAIFRRDGGWGIVGLLLGLTILGAIVGFAGFLYQAGLISPAGLTLQG